MNRLIARSLLSRLLLALAATAANGPAFADPVATGPTSKLYLMSENTASLYTIQGTAIIAGPAPTYCNHCESTIAVDGDIRSIAAFGSGGGLYNLDLSQTGTHYAASGNFQDGTTDGRRNYAVGTEVDVNGNHFAFVAAFGRDWDSQSTLFRVAIPSYADGITYDPTNDSLWITVESLTTAGGQLQNYSMSGVLLSSFETTAANALAMDYADDTLWVIKGPGTAFEQYSRSGAFLQSVYYGAVAGGLSTSGMEFDLAGHERVVDPGAVPEPQVAALLGIGFAGVITMRRRRTTATAR